MKVWIEAAVRVLRMLAGAPDSALRWFLFAGILFGVALLMLRIMGIAVGNARATWLLNLLVLILAAGLLLGALVAGRIYLTPLLGSRVAAPWLDVLSAAIGLLVLATPMMCLVQRVRYLTALVTLAVSGYVAALVFLLTVSARPGVTLEQVRERTERIHEQIAP